MKPFEKVAVEFAKALVEERWQDARCLLIPTLQQVFSPPELRDRFCGMFRGYSDGAAEDIHFDPEFSMETWPTMKEGDIGLAYVSILGDGFIEGVTVFVSEAELGLAIREIHWGRP